jgi:putative intracellular protease/amidase
MNTRREVLRATLAAAFATPAAVADDEAPARAKSRADGRAEGQADRKGHETVAMLLYPQFTALDLFGPHHLFASMMGAKVMLVAETAEPVASDLGVKVLPTTTFADCPEAPTILFVPGGTRGTLKAAESPAVRRFVRSRGEKAEWVTSVCTGSIVLGAAGLLDGYRATSHWVVRPQLALFGAKPMDQRVVIDRNRVTGAGVTSGLDFGLELVRIIRGTQYAQALQLLAEYDPKPPLDAGSEAKAPEEVVAMMRDMFREFREQVADLARRVARDGAAR